MKANEPRPLLFAEQSSEQVALLLQQRVLFLQERGLLVFTNTPNPDTNNFWRIRSVP